MAVIYIYENKINGKYYVGQALDFNRRHKRHLCNNQYIDKAFRKYGENNFNIILIECEESILNYIEEFYIFWFQSKYPNGYNLTDGGEGIKGFHHNQESKNAISKAAKQRVGEKNNRWGTKHSEETKNKISKSMSGKNNPNYGHTNKQAKKCFCEELKKEFISANQAAIWLRNNGFPNAATSCITRCCRKEIKTYYKYHWRYVEENNGY